MVERIRNLLESRQLTPTQFADLIGVARPIVSHVLSGRNKPSLEVVQRILAALPELSMPWLLNGAGPMYSAAASIPPAIAARQQEEVARATEEVARATEAVAESRAVPPSTATAALSSATSGVTQVEASRSAAKPVKRVVGNGPVPKRFAPEFVAPHPTTATAAAETAATARPSETSPSGPAQPPPPLETGNLAASAAGAASSENGASVATALFAGAEKPIRRIVIFYRDGSFADYQPE